MCGQGSYALCLACLLKDTGASCVHACGCEQLRRAQRTIASVVFQPGLRALPPAACPPAHSPRPPMRNPAPCSSLPAERSRGAQQAWRPSLLAWTSVATCACSTLTWPAYRTPSSCQLWWTSRSFQGRSSGGQTAGERRGPAPPALARAAPGSAALAAAAAAAARAVPGGSGRLVWRLGSRDSQRRSS